MGVLPSHAIEDFYSIYLTAFEPLRTRAAARHVLTREEFAEEMTDERIDKYVALDGDRILGFTTFTNDLSAVPWIEPAYYAAQYPDYAARDAIFYLGFTLTRPELQGSGVFLATLDPIRKRMILARGLVAFDVCAHNDAVLHLSAWTERSMSARADISMRSLDTQTYYAIEVHGPKSATS